MNSPLEGIEWGGDVHAPAGNVSIAKKIRDACKEANIETPSYGSYFRLGEPIDEAKRAFETAAVLGAETVRIWGGSKNGPELTESEWSDLVLAAEEVSQAATEFGVVPALEWHSGTVTSSIETSRRFLAESSLLSYWQPPVLASDEECLEGIRVVNDKLAHLHVFHWATSFTDRLTLADGEARWLKFFSLVPRDCWAFLEFVLNDSTEQVVKDAEVLLRLVTTH